MDDLPTLILWLAPPALLAALYRPIARARLGVIARNALAIGATAALVVLAGIDAIGTWSIGPWSTHPLSDWATRVALCAVTAAAFAFPTGWALGVIYQHWRLRRTALVRANPFADPALMAAWLTLIALLALYAAGLQWLLDLARQQRVRTGPRPPAEAPPRNPDQHPR
jgi:hypothetical protein